MAIALRQQQRCFLEWYPYEKDRTMGLNHQMASLSCALGEAFHLKRTLLWPMQICLFALHTQRWSDGGEPGERCVPTTELFDIERLSRLVPIRLVDNTTRPLVRPTHTARVSSGWSTQRVALEHPCVAGGTRLVRRHVDTFWFQQCTRRHTDSSALAAELNLLVGAPPLTPKPMNIILRTGLFFSPAIKAAAAAVRAAIGGPYASLHVRRSDKLTSRSHTSLIGGKLVTVPAACNPEDCRTRDMQTRPAAIEQTLLMWIPPGSHVYIGSTEPPRFFEPLRRTFRLHFAEDFGAQLANITNNYALYAVETLLFFGSQASVESLSFQSGWFVDACVPGASLRSVRRTGGLVRSWAAVGVNATRMTRAHAQHAGAVDIQCRDSSGVLINQVLYGPACGANLPCGRHMYLAPQPRPCGQPRLAERLMLTNRTGRAALSPGAGSIARRCAALAPDAYRTRQGAAERASSNKAARPRAQIEATKSSLQGRQRSGDAIGAASNGKGGKKRGSEGGKTMKRSALLG